MLLDIKGDIQVTILNSLRNFHCIDYVKAIFLSDLFKLN